MKRILLTIALASLACFPAGAGPGDADVTPLFASDDILEVVIDGPLREISRRSEVSTEVHAARLTAASETHSIEVSARGISRRTKEKCSFPPLRIGFPEKPGENSLFHKQKRIKLVTYCNDTDRFEQLMLREYTSYRLYNVLTPKSLRVRLARITYRDGGKDMTTRLGFFIEDADDAARRVGMKEVDIGNIKVSAINREDGARYSLFQYMIGNTDWAMDAGPDPSDCCHNSRLFGEAKDATGNLTPVPYDFDIAGLVDAPYALPSEKLRIRDVKMRVYRGYCAFNDHLPAQVAHVAALRPALEAQLAGTPVIDERTTASMKRYLGGFLDDAADSATLARKLSRSCL